MKKIFILLTILLIMFFLTSCTEPAAEGSPETGNNDQSYLLEGKWQNRIVNSFNSNIYTFNSDKSYQREQYDDITLLDFYIRDQGTYSYNNYKVTFNIKKRDDGSGLTDISDQNFYLWTTAYVKDNFSIIPIENPIIFKGGNKSTLHGTWTYECFYSRTVGGTTQTFTMTANVIINSNGTAGYEVVMDNGVNPPTVNTADAEYIIDTTAGTITIINSTNTSLMPNGTANYFFYGDLLAFTDDNDTGFFDRL